VSSGAVRIIMETIDQFAYSACVPDSDLWWIDILGMLESEGKISFHELENMIIEES
jgi:hypothetical protein